MLTNKQIEEKWNYIGHLPIKYKLSIIIITDAIFTGGVFCNTDIC